MQRILKYFSPSYRESKGDICRPIQPTSGSFKCFMVLVDASTCWSHVALWLSLDVAYAKLLAQIIRLPAHYPYHPINSIRLDIAIRVYIEVFLWLLHGIDIRHLVLYVYTQNGLTDGIKDVGNAYQPSSLCLGACSIACSCAYSSEVRRHPIFLTQ